jgi:hypothetical protein
LLGLRSPLAPLMKVGVALVQLVQSHFDHITASTPERASSAAFGQRVAGGSSKGILGPSWGPGGAPAACGALGARRSETLLGRRSGRQDDARSDRRGAAANARVETFEIAKRRRQRMIRISIALGALTLVKLGELYSEPCRP